MKTNLPSCELTRPYEVTLHYKRPLFNSMERIACAEDINLFLRAEINPKLMDVKEFFWVVFLSRANSILGISTIGFGTIDGVLVNIREILQLTLLFHASQLVVAHNHPSGKLTPSKKDKELTKKLKDALALFDVQLLDHLILTSEDFYSFSNDGEM